MKYWITALATLVLLTLALPARAVEWVQLGRISGDVVCGDLETGLGDNRQLRFHPYNRFMQGDAVTERIRLQRGSTVAVRLIGHGADLMPSVREEITGVSASITASGRYFNQPNASGPIGFVEVRIAVRDNAELGNNSVIVEWPTGRKRVPLRLVRDCEQTREAPRARPAEPDRCFGAAGTNCGAPVGPINPLATCARGLCLYNGGSIVHDQCCAANPSGHFCGNALTAATNERICRTDMDLAVSRVASGFSWHRETDFNKTNRDGRVVPADVCAPRGAIVHRDDERFCCSRMGVGRVEPTLAERNKSELNPLVKGYVTPGPARASIPKNGVACD